MVCPFLEEPVSCACSWKEDPHAHGLGRPVWRVADR